MFEELFIQNSMFGPRLMYLLIPLMIWDIIWRGIALWRAGRSNQLPWFIALLIVNSVGILPIIYILFFQKKEETKKEKK